MQIIRYSRGGEISYGILDEAENGLGFELVQLAGDPLNSGFDTTGERHALAEITPLSPVVPRSKVLLVELGEAGIVAETLVPNTAVRGHAKGPADVIAPPVPAAQLVAAPALAVVVGAASKDLRADDVLPRVLGFAVAAQFGWQLECGFTRYGCDGFTALGPVLETEAGLEGHITSAALQRELGLAELIAAVPEVLAELSCGQTLLPYDVLLLTREGSFVPVAHGQSVQVEAPGLGELTVHVGPAAGAQNPGESGASEPMGEGRE